MKRREMLALVSACCLPGCSGSDPIASRRVRGSARFSFNATAGTVLEIDIEVVQGGPARVLVSSEKGENPVFERTVKTSAEFSVELQHDGAHFIRLLAPGTAEIRVERA